MSTFFFATTAGRQSLQAHLIYSLGNVIDTADDELSAASCSNLGTNSVPLLRAMLACGPTLALFHFAGEAKQWRALQRAATTIGLASLPAYLAALPPPQVVFLNGCATSAVADELIQAEIELVIGTCAALPHAQTLAFTLAFYREFLLANRTAGAAYRRALQAAQIDQHQAAEQLVFVGNAKVRRSWLAHDSPPLVRAQRARPARFGQQWSTALRQHLTTGGKRMKQMRQDGWRWLEQRIHLSTAPRFSRRSALWLTLLLTALVAFPMALTTLGNIDGESGSTAPSGNTLGGNTLGGNTLGGNTLGGNTLGGSANGSSASRSSNGQSDGRNSNDGGGNGATGSDGSLTNNRSVTAAPLTSNTAALATLPMTNVRLQNPFTITTQSKVIDSLLFNPDATTLFAAGADNTIQRWQLPTGALLPTIQVNTTSVAQMAVNADGSQLTYGGRDGAVGVVNLAYSLRQELASHAGAVAALCLSHDGRMLFTSSMDGALVRDDLVNGERRILRQAPYDPVVALRADPTNKLLALATNQSIQIWRWATRETLYQLVGHQGPIRWLDFSPDGRYLLSAGSDQLIYLWDVAGERIVHQFADATSPVNVVRYFPDGALFIAAGDDGMIRIWDTRTYQKVDEIVAFPGGVAALVINHNGSQIAAAGRNGVIKLWNVVPGYEER